MKLTAFIAVAAAAVVAAQQPVYNQTTGRFDCPLPDAVYCAGDSLATNIIIRCVGFVGYPGNCNDNLDGEFPFGLNYSPCWASSTQQGVAACSKDCVVYGGSGNYPGDFTLTGCVPYATPSSSSSSASKTSSTSSTSVSMTSSTSSTSVSTTSSMSSSSVPTTSSMSSSSVSMTSSMSASSPCPTTTISVTPSLSSSSSSTRGLYYSNHTMSDHPSQTTITTSIFTTVCPSPTTLTYGSQTYTVTSSTTLTITDCHCTASVPPPYTVTSAATLTTVTTPAPSGTGTSTGTATPVSPTTSTRPSFVPSSANANTAGVLVAAMGLIVAYLL